MAKWTRDRMRRRKKNAGETSAATDTTPPLQPTYPEVAEGEQPEGNPEAEGNAAAPEESKAESTTPERARPKRRRKKKAARPAEQPVEEATATEPVEADEITEVPAVPEETAEPAEVAVPPVASEPEVEPALAPTPAPSAGPTPQTGAQIPLPISPKKGSKGAVVLAVGLPGSGKSTWFKRHGVTPLSSDMVRHLLFDNATEQRYQDLVFGTLRSLLRARLIARMPMNYVDATNLSPKERRHWIRMAKDFGYEAHAVYFDVPMEVCMDRNRRRHRVVPDDVMQRMNAKLRPPAFDEGFAKIIVVRVKPRASASIETGTPVNPDDSGGAE